MRPFPGASALVLSLPAALLLWFAPAPARAGGAPGIIASCADIPAAVDEHQRYLDWRKAREAARDGAITGFHWNDPRANRDAYNFDPLADSLRPAAFVAQKQNLAGCSFQFSMEHRLDYALFNGSNLSAAKFVDVSLRNADFTRYDPEHRGQPTLLRGATFSGVDLTGALFKDADLAGVVFEPAKLPEASDIAQARNLDQLTFKEDPSALLALRQRFRDAGFDEQDRAVNYAYHRTLRDRLWNRCLAASRDNSGRFWDCVSLAGSLAGDWSCAYGEDLWRPVRIGFWAWLLFALCFFLFMHHPGVSGLYLAVAQGLVLEAQAIENAPQVRSTEAFAALRQGQVGRWLHEEWHLARVAAFFSLVNGFNIGFREADIGRWIHLLPGREFEFRAVGWARTLAGVQALLTLYLLAVWLMCLFGHPFG
jgi:hypothetical protein